MRPSSAAAVAALVFAGCGSSGSNPAQGSSASKAQQIRLTSSAFTPGAPIPSLYTCDGRDLPIPLRWSGVPMSATELTLVMRDPDAPGGSFTHWSVTGIPPTSTSPVGGVQGHNGFGTVGYRGPCPPRGDKPHRYVITVTALAGHAVLAIGSLTGTYARP